MAIVTVRMVLMRVQPTAVNADRINVVRKFNTTGFLSQLLLQFSVCFDDIVVLGV